MRRQISLKKRLGTKLNIQEQNFLESEKERKKKRRAISKEKKKEQQNKEKVDYTTLLEVNLHEIRSLFDSSKSEAQAQIGEFHILREKQEGRKRRKEELNFLQKIRNLGAREWRGERQNCLLAAS